MHISSEYGKQQPCLNETCIHIASNILESMDSTVKPCDDFYAYACNGWIKKNPIPDGKTSWSTFFKLEQQNQLVIKHVLGKYHLENPLYHVYIHRFQFKINRSIPSNLKPNRRRNCTTNPAWIWTKRSKISAPNRCWIYSSRSTGGIFRKVTSPRRGVACRKRFRSSRISITSERYFRMRSERMIGIRADMSSRSIRAD